jgi:hypothetical protein
MDNLNKEHKRRKDGKIMRNREIMINDYKNSYLPYPISVLTSLDYCRNIIINHFKHSLVFALPISLSLTYALIPNSRKEGFNFKRNKYAIIRIYLLTYIIFVSVFSIDSFVFCDYCKPWSEIYKIRNSNEIYYNLLKGRVKTAQKESPSNIEKIKDKGLNEEDI